MNINFNNARRQMLIQLEAVIDQFNYSLEVDASRTESCLLNLGKKLNTLRDTIIIIAAIEEDGNPSIKCMVPDGEILTAQQEDD